MFTHDVVQIVDVYPRPSEGHKQTLNIEPADEPLSLGTMVALRGCYTHKIAIVAKDYDGRFLACQPQSYKTHRMKGIWHTELSQSIWHITAQIKQNGPKHIVLVKDDSKSVDLCRAVASETNLTVWTTVPRRLMEPKDDFLPEEPLSNLKIARIDVRLDLENIFIGLVKRGWRPDVHKMIEATRLSVVNFGEGVTTTGCADWGELHLHHAASSVIRRELASTADNSRYVVNQHGKNTADMKIANDLHTLVEYGVGGDLKDGLNRELKKEANAGRYLDPIPNLAESDKMTSQYKRSPKSYKVPFVMQIAAMHVNRWRFVCRYRLESKFKTAGDILNTTPGDILNTLAADEWLTLTPNSPSDAQGQAGMLKVDAPFPVLHYFDRRIPDYGNYLDKGMTRVSTVDQLCVPKGRTLTEHGYQATGHAGAKEPGPACSPTQFVITWTSPKKSLSMTGATDGVGSKATPQWATMVSSNQPRQVLSTRLNDLKITPILFFFWSVHRDVNGAPKSIWIHILPKYPVVNGCEDESSLKDSSAVVDCLDQRLVGMQHHRERKCFNVSIFPDLRDLKR